MPDDCERDTLSMPGFTVSVVDYNDGAISINVVTEGFDDRPISVALNGSVFGRKTSSRPPDEIKSDLMDEVMPGASKEAVQHLVWEIIEDVISSFRLAGTDPDAITTVEDYVGNHYGVDDGWEA